MRVKAQEVDVKDGLPEPGQLVEVMAPDLSPHWEKAKLIKDGKFPLFEAVEFRGTVGAVTKWREAK